VKRRDQPEVDHVVRLELPAFPAPAALEHETDEQHVDGRWLVNLDALPEPRP